MDATVWQEPGENKMHNMTRIRYRRRVTAQRARLWLKAFAVFEAAVGGLSGVLIGALVIECLAGPGHPYYVGIRAALAAVFGVEGPGQ